MSKKLGEVKRLYKMGWAIHYLRPHSKIPLESKWTTGPRKRWAELLPEFSEDYNIGVRLGTPSKIGDKFLCVIDVDIKSSEKRHLTEALKAAKTLREGARCPRVDSGRGNGSRHYYCLTDSPFKTFNPFQSNEIVELMSPSKKPSKAEIEKLGEKKIKEGWRLGPAWEISLYSDGRQVVLPPSIHPDTKKEYTWGIECKDVAALPVLNFTQTKAATVKPQEKRDASSCDLSNFEATDVDLEWLPISDSMRKAIIEGEGVQDRSGFLMKAVPALFSAGLTEHEILSVLTDPRYFLSGAALERRKDRASAAEWVQKYTMQEVKRQRDPSLVFTPIKDAEAEPETDKAWQNGLVRSGQGGFGPPRNTMSNIILILKNAAGEKIFVRDEFAYRDTYGCDAPWGTKKGTYIGDDELSKIISWFSREWGLETHDGQVRHAITDLACANAYDPVKNWLDDLPEWDRKPRCHTWLRDHFEAEGDAEYLKQVFTKWMVATVGRVYRPGLKFDWMPIFEGAQGVGKSSFGRVLVGDKFFLDWLPNLADKDAALGLQGMWSVEMGELASFRKNELEIIKAFITRTTDKFRPPHGRRLNEYPRRCVFFGTTNRETYLRDDTGNRRFKPVKVGQLDFTILVEERTQLFAEAKWRFQNELKNSWDLELTGKAKRYEKIIHQRKMVEDDSVAMSEQMMNFIEKIDAEKVPNFNPKSFRMIELFEGVGCPFGKWRWDGRNRIFCAKMLKKLGARQKTVDGNPTWEIDVKQVLADIHSTPDENDFF